MNKFIGSHTILRYVRKMTKPRASFLISTLAFFLWVSVASGAVTTEVFSARAINERGDLEYMENHTVSYENGKVTRSRTLYFDPAGRMIGELISEYLPSPQFNTYSFKDMRAGYEDGLAVEGRAPSRPLSATTERGPPIFAWPSNFRAALQFSRGPPIFAQPSKSFPALHL